MDKDMDKAKTHLQRVPTLLLKRMKTSSKLSASTIRRKAIMPINILKKKNKSQKISGCLGNLHANDCS